MDTEEVPAMEQNSSPLPSPSAVNLIIRFTASIPDLPLLIDDPALTTAVSLKQQIRTHLSPPLSTSRLRLIYAGKPFPDTDTLSTSLRLPPPPPKSSSVKGKTPIYPPRTLYIHCSISDALSPADLAAEAALASASAPPDSLNAQPATQDDATTTPAPRGFDRLLTAGFTPLEIASLRSQFLAIQAHTHTPDTMPSASELRTLEDRWIDNGSSAANTSDGFGGLGTLDGEDDVEGAGLDDLLWGSVVGFFWPVGAVVWGLREEGVWSKRRQIAVVTGVLVNVAFSVLRFTS